MSSMPNHQSLSIDESRTMDVTIVTNGEIGDTAADECAPIRYGTFAYRTNCGMSVCKILDVGRSML